MKQSSKDTDEMDNEDNEDLFAELGGITLSEYTITYCVIQPYQSSNASLTRKSAIPSANSIVS